MLILLLALPLDLAADRFELRGDAWWAEGRVGVVAGDLHLSADTARGFADPACADGRARLMGSVQVTTPGARATADEVELCLPHTALAHHLRLEAPRFALDAERATWQAGHIEAQGVSATACACPNPPWRFTTRHAQITPGEGAWAEWPVLWVGPVPVATAPRWYVPLARRRTGFLFPIMGFDGEDGFHARQPFFLTLGQSADLTLAPGYRDGDVSGHTTLRWAASEHERGALEARLLATRGAAFSGRGSLPLGPARLAIEGSASTDEAVRQALWPGLAARAQDHLRGTFAAAIAGRRTGLGLSATRLEDQSRPEGDRVMTVAPDLWLRWHAAAGPAELILSGRTLTLLEDGDPKTLADVGVDLEIPLWISALQLRPVAGFATTVHLDDGQGQTGALWAGGEARIAAARWLDTLRHEIALVLDGRWAHAADPARGALLAIDLPLSSRAAGATLETHLASEQLSARLAVRGGYEAEGPVKGWEQPLLTWALEAPVVRTDGGFAGTEATWGVLRGESEHLRAHAGLTRLRPTRRTPTLRRLGPQRPLAVSTLTGELTTAEAGAGFTLGRFALDYAAVADVEGEALLGQEAGLAYASGCDCWSVRLGLGHEQGRDLPDVWLALTVP